MTRRIWLIATMAALFGLQAPLCAFACVELSAIERDVAEAAMPCHKQSSEARSPGDTGSKEDCSSCDQATYEALASAPELNVPALQLAVAATPTRAEPVDASPRVAELAAVSTDLPPPDILLLKSTLLV